MRRCVRLTLTTSPHLSPYVHTPAQSAPAPQQCVKVRSQLRPLLNGHLAAQLGIIPLGLFENLDPFPGTASAQIALQSEKRRALDSDRDFRSEMDDDVQGVDHLRTSSSFAMISSRPTCLRWPTMPILRAPTTLPTRATDAMSRPTATRGAATAMTASPAPIV